MDFYTDSNVNIYSYLTTHVATNRDADQAPLMRRLNEFLFEGVFSSSGCLGKAVLFYCGSPLAFHIYYAYYMSQIAYDWGFLPSHYIDLVAKATHGSFTRAKFVLSLYLDNISKEINSHTILSTC